MCPTHAAFSDAPIPGTEGNCTKCSLDGSHCSNIDIAVQGVINTGTGFCDCIAHVINSNHNPVVEFDVVVWSDDCTETNYDSRYDESCGGEPRFQADYVPNTCGL